MSPALAGSIFTTVPPGKPGVLYKLKGTLVANQSTHACIPWEDPRFPEAWSRVAPSVLSALVGSPGLLPFQAATCQDSCERSEFQKGKTMVMGRVT